MDQMSLSHDGEWGLRQTMFRFLITTAKFPSRAIGHVGFLFNVKERCVDIVNSTAHSTFGTESVRPGRLTGRLDEAVYGAIFITD